MTLLDNLVGYWRFDESSGSAADSSGNGHILVPRNSAGYTTGKINNGAALASASNQYFNCTADAALSPGALTISAWIKLNTINQQNTIVERYNSGVQYADQWMFYVSSLNVLRFGRATTNSDWLSVAGTTTLTTGTWYHVVATYDGTTLKVYLNGNLEINSTALSGISTSTSGELRIGQENNTAGTYFDGVIDELGLWSRVLSATEVSNLYNSGSGLAFPFGLDPGVLFDNALLSNQSNNVSGVNISYTTGSNANRGMMVAIFTNNGALPSISSLTYAGQALTPYDQYKPSVSCNAITLYYLKAPAAGTNNLTVTATSGGDFLNFYIITYTGVDQTSPFPTKVENWDGGSTVSSFAPTLTTALDKSWLGCFTQSQRTVSAGASTTQRTNSTGGCDFFDSGGAKTPTGSYSLNINLSMAIANNSWVVYEIAKASLVTTQTQTSTAKTRIKLVGNDKTSTAKSRIKVLGNNKTVTVKERIKQVGVTKTATAKAYIQGTGTKTVTAKVDIKKFGVTQTFTAKMRVEQANLTITAQAKGRMLVVNTKTSQAKGRIYKLANTKTATAKALIVGLVTQTATAKARIEVGGVTYTISALSRIKNTISRTFTAKARIWAAAVGVIIGRNVDTGIIPGTRQAAQLGRNVDTGILTGTRLTKSL